MTDSVGNPFGNKLDVAELKAKADEANTNREIAKMEAANMKPAITGDVFKKALSFKPTKVVKAAPKSDKPPSEKAKILAEFNYCESDIPVNHRYWKLPR